MRMDGKVLEKPEVTCPQGGCPLSGELTIHSGEYAAGAHTLEVIATDGVGLSTTKTIDLTLEPPAPSVTLSGTVTEQGTLGYTRPRYTLKVAASAEEGTGVSASSPTYVSSFGTAGSGAGQFGQPLTDRFDQNGNVDEGAGGIGHGLRDVRRHDRAAEAGIGRCAVDDPGDAQFVVDVAACHRCSPSRVLPQFRQYPTVFGSG